MITSYLSLSTMTKADVDNMENYGLHLSHTLFSVIFGLKGTLRRNLKITIDDLKKRGTTIMMDSGGFSFHLKTYKHINPTPKMIVDAQNFFRPDWMIQLDYPLALAKTPEERPKLIQKTLNNYAELFDGTYDQKMLDKILPTVHGWTKKELRMSVNGILKINPNVKYICIGSLVPFFAISQNPRIFNKKNGIKLIQYVMSIIPKHIKVHALGLSINNFPFLVKLGIHSADSTSPFLSSSRANFMFKDRWTMTYLKSSQYNSLHTNSFGQKLLYNKFRDCQCPPCSEYKPEQVAQKFVDFRKSDFDARAKRRVHNGWIYQSMYADEVRLFEEGKYFKTIIPQYKYKNAYHSIFNKSMLM